MQVLRQACLELARKEDASDLSAPLMQMGFMDPSDLTTPISPISPIAVIPRPPPNKTLPAATIQPTAHEEDRVEVHSYIYMCLCCILSEICGFSVDSEERHYG